MHHILTIDDEAAIRDILRDLLISHGFRVTAVESASEGLAVVRSDPPDLIITDLQLDESDGFELIDEVKQIAPKIPIMLLTGVLFDPATIRRLAEKRIACYLEKTASLARILQEIRTILERK
jgi:CheY-like chemotaxis protein